MEKPTKTTQELDELALDERQACTGGGMSSRDPSYDEQCKAGPSGKCVQCRRDMRDYSEYE